MNRIAQEARSCQAVVACAKLKLGQRGDADEILDLI